MCISIKLYNNDMYKYKFKYAQPNYMIDVNLI